MMSATVFLPSSYNFLYFMDFKWLIKADLPMHGYKVISYGYKLIVNCKCICMRIDMYVCT